MTQLAATHVFALTIHYFLRRYGVFLAAVFNSRCFEAPHT